MMLKNGMFLQNRYEIISCIGSGGMADVYKAKDHKLNRYVAVKVLKQEFKNDKAFLSKFRVEAQAAAGLAHVNIVNVYDVGEDQGVNFIVMELVEGITLKAYISKKGKLSVREATSIALQVAAGLEAAHNNGIVHRDVKPQNILISMDGKAKIADFGIARAANSNTINSNAMGSVHYCSPEQTRGGYSDAKSDIYSMGITMFEMITGRVPFDGDTTVEVALKHLQEEIPSPRKFTPDLPFSTEQIVLKCTQKSPDRRYNNMAELIRDLRESLVNPGGNFVVIPKLDKNAHTIKLTREEISQIKNGSLPSYDPALNTGAADTHREEGSVAGDSRMYPYGGNYYQNSGYQDLKHNQERGWREGGSSEYAEDYGRGTGGYVQYDDGYPEDDYDREEGRRRRKEDDDADGSRGERIITVISILAAVAVGLVILFFVGRSLGLFTIGGNRGGSDTGTAATEQNVSTLVAVPELRGKTEEEARKLLKDLELGYNYQGESPSAEYPKGQVLSQSIEANAPVEKHTTIGYVLSSGASKALTVPDLENETLESAEAALEGMGLQVKVDTSRYSDAIPEGNVITTNPGAGSSVNAGETVTLYISQGTDSTLVEVPNVTGGYLADAQTMLGKFGLYAYITEVESDTVEKGIVISQDIAPGTKVQTGSAVTITVSAGKADAEDIVIQDGGTGSWKCNAQLNPPAGYESGQELAVRIDLKQEDEISTIFEGTTTFPYILNVEGKAGVGTGTVYVYLLDSSTWQVNGDPIVYDNVTFTYQ